MVDMYKKGKNTITKH